MTIADNVLLGAVRHEQGFDVNPLLWRVAECLRRRGAALAGAVQRNVASDGVCCATMDLVDLGSGRVVGISQNLGPEARGCRLDQRGLAEEAQVIASAIAHGADLVVINKFGKAESEGSGLLSCFADAMEAGIPLLTTVREPYLEAWRAFHGGLAIELAPEQDAVLDWCEAVTGRTSAAVPARPENERKCA